MEQVEEEEIIIETECASDEVVESTLGVFKPELDDDDEFTWDEESPFLQYNPPTKKIKKPRKNKDVDESGSGSKGKVNGQKYKKDWEKMPQFKKWLSVSIIGPEYFYCKMCKTDAKCGKSEIMRHMTSKKHTKNSTTMTSKNKIFEGLLCPVFTPIDKMRFEEINYTKISDYADYLRKHSVKAVLVNDSAGEGTSLTVIERCLVVEEWVKACLKTKQYLMVQVGGAPLKEVIKMVRHSASKKANAIVVMPDLYNRPKDHYDLLRYIKDISDHADGLPIWYQHCPSYSHVTIDLKKFMVDVAEIEAFVGIIFNSECVDEVLAASSANTRLNFIIATNYGILGAAAHGFKTISSPTVNYLPAAVQSVYNAVTGDKLSEARESQKIINEVVEMIYEQGQPVAAMKSAMNIISRLNLGQVRRPLVDIWKKQVDQMQVGLKTLGIIS